MCGLCWMCRPGAIILLLLLGVIVSLCIITIVLALIRSLFFLQYTFPCAN
jgi:hypothetical protein